jgi:signal transduction histidine kinase/ligand-binding sensor domain-containing protein/DNA-binding NarL/FixJ family response regulator
MDFRLISIIPPGIISWFSGLLYFMLLLCPSSGSAQSVRFISTNDGLPQSFVSGLEQDDTGFVWIGTRNGLARYDGIDFKVFQHDPYDSATLASNLIIWIKKDHKNQLWIEHESGEIDGLNPVTEKVTHLLTGNLASGEGPRFVRRGWLVDQDGIFWGIVRGKGINAYDGRSNKTERFTSLNSGFPSDTIRGLVEMKNREIWVLSHRGISRFDKKTNQFTHWQIPYRQDYGVFPESDAIAVDLHERSNGELMWGDRQSLFFFDPRTYVFRTVRLPNISYLGIRWIRTSKDGIDYCESYGKIYRYSDKDGLASIGETITTFFGDVKSFLVDLSGLIWIGTNAGGILQIDLATPFFHSFPYKQDFGTDMFQQIFGIDLAKMFDWNANDRQFSSSGYLIRSAFDSNKKLFLALKETVCYYDSLQKKFVKLPRAPVVTGDPHPGDGIKGITVTPTGIPMIIGGGGNIFSFDFSENSWHPVLDTQYLRKKLGNSFLPVDMLADDENIWITTADDGLLIIDIRTKEVRQIKESPARGTLPTNQLLGLRADPRQKDLLWIGSYEGLICLHKKTLQCEIFSYKEGLPDNNIYSILSDRKGFLWLGTNKGICRFDPISKKVREFHMQHGLPGEEFNRFHKMELPDGHLIFGGTSGWTSFDPLLIRNDDFDPELAFTDLKINNKETSKLEKNALSRLSMNSQDQLDLPYEQNTLTIGFAGLEFSQPQDLNYRYRLYGYDNDWVQAGNTHQANYTKIPPGTYTLFVNASNTSGKWSTHIKSIKVRIEPPWWSTRMAYICYSIILAGLTWTFIRFRVSRAVMKQEMLLKEKEAEQLKELDDMKTRFFSNITHEFRTPLTLIMGPAEQIKLSVSQDPQQTKLADTIVNNAKQMLILINRLLDLSKLEANALKLYEQRGNPADAVGSILHSFETDALAKEIQLSFENHSGHLECWFYADALERIVYNLVSNALKFTGAGGSVIVSLTEKNGMLCLTVADTGIGIAENKLPHIFDRFYQAGDHTGLARDQWDRGTGIGLALVKELVLQMDGKIEVESRTTPSGHLSSGTIFTMTMPYRETAERSAPVVQMAEQDANAGEQADESDKIPQILLVEDSQELAGFVTGILSEQYHIHHALNGALGEEYAVAMMPDLIISDVMMPIMDGYELCRRLKEDIRTSHIPMILLTAKVSKENLMEGLSMGADDYLTKPFHPTELLLRIHNLLQRQQRLRNLIRQELSNPDSSPLEREPVLQDIFVTRLYEVLDLHLDDSLFGVDQLVEAINMSRSSLHRKLKALTGMATSEVVRNYRLKKATVFLREGYSSSDSAYKSGFGSPAYFTKCFREVYGITPGEYIRHHKN